jgi:hypothetical protein
MRERANAFSRSRMRVGLAFPWEGWERREAGPDEAWVSLREAAAAQQAERWLRSDKWDE